MKANIDYIYTLDRNYAFSDHVDFPLELLWEFKTEAKMHRFMSVPLVSGDTVFFIVTGDKVSGPIRQAIVYAIDLFSGQKLWDYRIYESMGWISQSCFAEGIFVTSTTKGLIGLKGGEVVFKIPVGKWINGLVWAENKFIVRRYEQIDIIDINDGLIDRIKVSHPSAAAFTDGKFVFGAGSNLFCYTLKNCKLFWETDLSDIGRYYDVVESNVREKEIYTDGKFTGRFAAIYHRRVYCCVGQFMVAVDFETGEILWKGDAKGEPVCVDDKIISLSQVDGISCLDAKNGALVYKKDPTIIHGLGVSMPFVSGNTLFVGADRLLAFNIDNGDLIWEFKGKHKGATAITDPVYVNGRLYAGCTDGYFYCLGLK